MKGNVRVFSKNTNTIQNNWTKSKNEKLSADEIMKLIYIYTHKNPDNLEFTEL